MVTDYDCWYADHDSVTVEMVIGNLRANAALATEIVRTTDLLLVMMDLGSDELLARRISACSRCRDCP